MTCANLMTHKLEMMKWYFIIFIDDCEFWKIKFDIFNFYNENWNLCCIEYPSLKTKILIKNFFLIKDNSICLIFELQIVWTIFGFWTLRELNSLVESMNVYSLGML